ncbi:hypothetical protein Taro_042984 [Colocasia esculenta]|uniref:Uncharacterized protein n=1 Tax=Colocasia esculenta TaxID=4460 RepID=A0A843WQY8_COLES|nr:hypothetical protein [Colocasia esculenta]
MFQCLTLGFSADAPKGVRLGPTAMCGVVSLHGSCLVEVERQLNPSSVAARLRGVRESRRIHIPPVVPFSAIVDLGPRHQQSKVLTYGALGKLDIN